MTPAQRLAIVAVILRADNKSGLAWAAYRGITKELGLSPATIRDGFNKAEGRYLERAGIGLHGAVQYRVLRPTDSASTYEAPGASQTEALAPHSGPLSASQTEAPALHFALSSASQTEAILTPMSNPKSNPSTKRAADKPPPDPRVKEFIDGFCRSYQEARGQAYIVAGGKDGATVKRLLAALDADTAGGGLGELQRATRAMLADSWGRPRATIGLLSSLINTWRGNGKRATADVYRKGF